MEDAVEGVEPWPVAAEQDHQQAAMQQPAGRVLATAAAPPHEREGAWRCHVCGVECGGREAFREHCGSDQHFDGLQVFVLHPDLFTDSPAAASTWHDSVD